MKRITIIASRIALMLMGALVISCDSYLDELPDNRTELDTPEKITQILVSAYPGGLHMRMFEQMSDNVTDIGENYNYGNSDYANYCWNPTSGSHGTSQDSPQYVWIHCYSAIAAANAALEAIEAYTGPAADVAAQKGEALLCRAFSHFLLVNIFCQAYNPQSSDTDLGIPYVTWLEKTVFGQGERGTVADVYAKIDADLQAGIPLINDNLYTQIKYHFNQRAANAFAAKFYLYYGKYEKSIEYANACLGNDPSANFRVWSNIVGTSDREYTNCWNAAEEPANILNIGFLSWWARYLSTRYVMSSKLITEVTQTVGPWGAKFSAWQRTWVMSSRAYYFPKFDEYFYYTDIVAGTGYGYHIWVAFTTEKVLTNRAEAYVMLGEYEKAAADLNMLYKSFGATTDCDLNKINDWYATADERYVKPIAPRFDLLPGTQTNLLHACLHIRRVQTSHEGERFEDVKRMGMTIKHAVDKATVPMVLNPFDKRCAVQIPTAIVNAGMQPNP